MVQDPNRPLETWEVRDFMESTRDFRSELEKERIEFRAAVRAIPEIQRELNRQSVALFSTNEDNEFGMQGMVPTMREMLICWRVLRRMVPWLWSAIAALVALIVPVIGLLWQLLTQGVIKLG